MVMTSRAVSLSHSTSSVSLLSVSYKTAPCMKIPCIKNEILMVMSCPVDVLWGERGCVMGRAVAPSRGAALRTAKARPAAYNCPWRGGGLSPSQRPPRLAHAPASAGTPVRDSLHPGVSLAVPGPVTPAAAALVTVPSAERPRRGARRVLWCL